ncbi:MAG: MFS transporter [Candidatus Ranarchaeia archaeon]
MEVENNSEVELKKLNNKFGYFNVLGSLSYGLIGTFLILYLLDFLNFIEVGLLMAIGFGIQAIADYPTGALGDYLGHKVVLSIGYVLHIISVIVLLNASTFTDFVIYIILSYLGASQESGALQAWFDNSYRINAEEIDPKRVKYGALMGTLNMLNRGVMAIMIVSSGIIATFFGRKSLFVIQIFLLILYLVSVMILMHKPKKKVGEKQQSYFSIIFKGLNFVRQSKANFFIFLGIAISQGVIGGFWGSLILFPLYSSYAHSDAFTGLLRFLIWGIGIGIGSLAINPSKKIKDTRKGLMYVMLPSSVGIFVSVTIYYFFFPPLAVFDLLRFTGLIVAFNLTSLLNQLNNILQTRFIIDFIPDETRNALYSLFATFGTILSIPFTIIGGFIIEGYGLLLGMFIVTVFTFIGGVIVLLGLYFIVSPKLESKKESDGIITST